jgi:hypothetical protein
MTAASFQPGDRVRARISTPIVQAGTLGRVVQAYPTMRGAYEIRFDDRPTSILMWEDELELADRPTDDTPQP